MAEGLLRSLYGDRYEVFSAGTVATRVKPLAIEAMRLAGIEISGHASKHIDALAHIPMDYVVTVCDSAREACPFFPARKEIIHHSFVDPSNAEGTASEKLAAFCRTRDEIRAWIIRRFGGENV